MKPRVIKQYKIIRRLGSGGGGLVYYAKDSTLLRPVVLKMLRRGSGSSEKMRANILREARLASAIEHPNVCSIYEVGESDGQAFIVMQYVPGRTLDKLIEAGPMSLQLVLSIGIQIADGLAEAHRLGIVHRDLKPANIVVTDGGLIKILDFGLAKRNLPEEVSPAAGRARAKKRYLSSRFGTVAYMAPEQFVTGRSSEQSDIFAFGVILFQMCTGSHPFLRLRASQPQIARAIQFLEVQNPRQIRPEIPSELDAIILKALEKNPANRFGSAAEMREALKTLMKSLEFDFGALAGQAPTVAPAAEADRKSGLFSLLAERFMRLGASEAPPNSIAVLPFTDLAKDDGAPFYGFALADAIGTRLARLPSLVVRPPSALSAAMDLPADPLEAGKKFHVTYVLRGSFLRSKSGFDLNWQLVDVSSTTVRSGGTIAVPSLDLVTIQNEICDQVYASLLGSGHLQAGAPQPQDTALGEELSEEYLQARALLSNFLLRSSSREDLDVAQRKFKAVLQRNPRFAPAHSGLGITHLEYVRKGFGGVSHLMAAQKCFAAAMEVEPELVEARLFRVYTLLSRGEKESARHAVRHLLEKAGDNFDVYIVAGVILRLDGLYDAALNEFNAALRLNPACATVVYDHRARIYHYQGQLELAFEEIRKGLTLEPKHPLLRTSLGYLYFRQGNIEKATETLFSVLQEDASLRMAYPTLAMCYLQAGQRQLAEPLITEGTVASAEADGEMAYRLATYFALDGDAGEALSWLRKAIYLGNENFPWLANNPAWKKLQGNEDFQSILAGLKRTYRSNLQRWKWLRSELPPARPKTR